jgi:DNA-binding transcriptional ArsR family regulator
MSLDPQNVSVRAEMSLEKNAHTIVMRDQLANAAKLLGEPARAAMLMELMSGRALPAGELASAANVSPQTASEHLARLTEGGLVTAHPQGWHRYYSLAAPEVADAIESMFALTLRTHQGAREQSPIPQIGSLAHARTCYSHLAGWLGVKIADALQSEGYLLPSAGRMFAVTGSGIAWFEELGIAVPAPSDRKLARQCLDWTERRPHLAGKLGVLLYKQLVALCWITPARNTRAVRVTFEGKQALSKHLGIAVS